MLAFDLMSLVVNPHLPLWRPVCLFGASSAFQHPTLVFVVPYMPFLAPHLPYGTTFAFWTPFTFQHPHSIGSQKGPQPER